jgi:hypothetical protein
MAYPATYNDFLNSYSDYLNRGRAIVRRAEVSQLVVEGITKSA